MTKKPVEQNHEFQNYHHSLMSIIVQIQQNPLIPVSKKDTIVRILSKYAKREEA